MTHDDLRQIRERCEAATAGPWAHDVAEGQSAVLCGPAPGVIARHGVQYQDADFVAHSRTDLPRLLAIAEAAQRLASCVSPWGPAQSGRAKDDEECEACGAPYDADDPGSGHLRDCPWFALQMALKG